MDNEETQPEVEWKRGVDFAEFAEALGIRTTQIMLAHSNGEKTTVVYTPELDEDDLDPETPMCSAQLARDDDGILRTTDGPVLLNLTWLDVQNEIEARMADDQA